MPANRNIGGVQKIKKAEVVQDEEDGKVPAGIDRKDHVENCRVDEHLACID
ncbi:hypothetical protein T09_15150 [Trichinella sp. T9]|nr:hypothetical protein T09_15150 [Trichinella sp. T9]